MTQALPRWNLKDFYQSVEDPQIQADLDYARGEAEVLKADFSGKMALFPPAVLGKLIQRYEAVQEVTGKIMSYAYLEFATQMNDEKISAFFQNMQEKMTEISQNLLFIELELSRIDDEDIEPKFADPSVGRYQPWIHHVRTFRAHTLSDEAEEILLEKSVTSGAAWVRLFDETEAALRFNYDGKKLTMSEVLDLFQNPDASVRKAAAQAFEAGLKENARLFTLIFNNLLKDKQIEDKKRNYATPVARRNLANQVDDETVSTLARVVKSRYADLSHRYYKMKAKWMGMERLNSWDRNMPLDTVFGTQKARQYSWDEAREIVLAAFHDFSPEMAAIGKRFFDQNWIDAPAVAGKSSGAFSHPTVPSVHPYILMNFQGKARDVMTLAHELGHGCHQVLAAEQGLFLADTPLTLAETASVFGEMLTFKRLLREATDPQVKKALIAMKVEDMLSTCVRQIAFHNFEAEVHEKRLEGELSTADLCAIWTKHQAESLGDGVALHEDYGYYWAYIPHFLHTPFYVYAYAFGDLLVNRLYGLYEAQGAAFVPHYLDMLKAGGTLRYDETLKRFGLNPKEEAFWQGGADVISKLIDQLETL